MTVSIRSGSSEILPVKVGGLTPCHTAGSFHFFSTSYIQARNFLFAEKDIPSVTLVGQIFDQFLDTAPGKVFVSALDGLGRYIFDVCDADEPQIKKRMHPAFMVVIMSGGSRRMQSREANCSTTFAIKSVHENHAVNETIEFTLLKRGYNCSNWERDSPCVSEFMNNYFFNYTPSYELYNLNTSLGTKIWNYTNGSWTVSCEGDYGIPSTFLTQVQKDLEKVIECEYQVQMHAEKIFGLIVAGCLVGGVVMFCVFKAAQIVDEDHDHLLEEPKTTYGAVEK